MNLSGTTHLKLESRPAFRNFPDSANLEDKKGRFESQLPDLSLAFMSDFLRNGSKLFHHSHSEDVQRSMTKENMESRGAYFVVIVCISLYRYRYINLVNFVGLSFRNFHHLDLFSLNLDLVYGGIRFPIHRPRQPAWISAMTRRAKFFHPQPYHHLLKPKLWRLFHIPRRLSHHLFQTMWISPIYKVLEFFWTYALEPDIL